MSKELKIRVQWPSGTMLPVLTHHDATGAELIRLLRFACSTKEEIILAHNGIPLDPELTLENQIINDDDVINAAISKKKGADEPELSQKIRELVLEAARVNDRHLNAMELVQTRTKFHPKVSTDDSFDYYEETPNLLKRPTTISTEPLPPFWNQKDVMEGEDPLIKTMMPRFATVEEASQFLTKKEWPEWMW